MILCIKNWLNSIKILLVLFFIFLAAGCSEEKPIVAFSNSPFTRESGFSTQNTFHVGEKIYFGVYNPKGFNTRLLKLQIMKKESEKSEFWGYEYLYNRTIELNNKTSYTDYIVINNAGFYIFNFFDYTDFQQPVIVGIIKVE